MGNLTSFRKLTAVNLIVGSLGSGKTTLLRNLIACKPKNENWAILINEFGAIGLDNAIISTENSITSRQIPGGCICCTAQSELKQATTEIIEQHSPDRLLIEPTGLGEPTTLIDLLHQPLFQNRFDIQTTYGVIDSSQMTVEEIERYTVVQNLINMSDVLILNKTDISSDEQVNNLYKYCESVFPAKQSILKTNHADIGRDTLFYKPLNHQFSQQASQQHLSASKPITLADSPLPALTQRKAQQTDQTLSIGWVFSTKIEFDWAKFQQLLENLNQVDKNIIRAKAILKVGNPWMLFNWINQQNTRETIAYRRDSRIEILMNNHPDFDSQKIENEILKCIKPS